MLSKMNVVSKSQKSVVSNEKVSNVMVSNNKASECECGLKWTGLKWTWSQMNMVSNECLKWLGLSTLTSGRFREFSCQNNRITRGFARA